MSRKSLGTLTLDLIAKVGGFEEGMDKASRKSQKTARQIEKYSNQIGKAITAASATALAGMTALVASTANGAREVRNFAQLSGASAQEFQRGSYAVKRYGIETDKYADILKDVNDRVGDFLQTGGGPMADFFENIAPKVGVTADQFARLSGPEALQLYVNTLERAGLSQQEMTFYMEALASDATALLPLLRNNGKEFKALGDEAERTGNVLSDIELGQLENIRRGVDELAGAATGIKNELVMGALPAIEDLVDLLSDPQTMQSAQALGSAIVTAMNKAAQAIDGTIKITKFLAEELAAMTNGAAGNDIVRLEEQLETLQSMLDNPTERLRFFGKDGVIEFYDEDEIKEEIELTKQQIARARALLQEEIRNAPPLTLIGQPDVPDTAGRASGISGEGNDDEGSEEEFVSDRFKNQMDSQVELYKEYQEEQTRIAKQEAQKRQLTEERAQSAITSMHYSTWQAAAGFLNTFAGESKAAALASIAITKGLAIAQTLAHTHTASMLAFASQIVPGDPTSIGRGELAMAKVQSMGALKATLIAATGLAEGYQALSGGGSVGTGGYSSSGTHPPAPTTPDPTFSEDLEEDRRGVQIIFNGDVNGLDADQIARSIKDHLDSTDFVLIEPASRNGRALSTG